MQLSALFVDASAQAQGWGETLAFGQPLAQRRALTLDEAPGLLAWAETEARAGRFVVLALAYEAAPAFDAALVAHAPQQGLPLAWAASHAGPLPAAALPAWAASAAASSRQGPPRPAMPPDSYALGPWQALVAPRLYAERFARLQQEIRDGETYQANYTVPFECRFQGDERAWFADLVRAQAAGFCAWLDLGRNRVLSLSPELFFRVDGDEALARPMKGTAARDAALHEDAAAGAALAACAKNRAENVMVVDLLRSDLGRVARPGGVRVPRLFHVEAYPTVFQMTSDVAATLRPGVGLQELLAALFPCGSVTGAPKVRTMQLLRGLEPEPRGLYCGAIGLLRPASHARGWDAVFSVPIRTVVLDRHTGLARFGVGGGVTHDSTARAEYAEIGAKMRFLLPPGPDGALLESLLLLRGRYPLLEGHLARLCRSAEALGFPLDEAAARETLQALARAHPQGRCKARLLLGRDGVLRAEAAPIAGGRLRQRVGFAPAPVDCGDGFLAHKTTRRAVYEAALAACPGCDDALLLNQRGEVTESTRASLVLRLDGELVTPPLACGLLPGVFRQRLLDRGLLRERVLFPADVLRAERVWLVNAVRWWMPCEVAGR